MVLKKSNLQPAVTEAEMQHAIRQTTVAPVVVSALWGFRLKPMGVLLTTELGKGQPAGYSALPRQGPTLQPNVQHNSLCGCGHLILSCAYRAQHWALRHAAMTVADAAAKAAAVAADCCVQLLRPAVATGAAAVTMAAAATVDAAAAHGCCCPLPG